MKWIVIALLAIATGSNGAIGQTYPRTVTTLDTMTNLLARNPIDEETILVLNRVGDTNWGPLQFWRHSKNSSAATNLSSCFTAIRTGRWMLVTNLAQATSGISGLLVNGTGEATNLVDTTTVTWSNSGGAAYATAIAPIFNGLLACVDDSTIHTLGIAKLGTNYLLSITQATNAPGPYPSSIPLSASDLSVHLMRVRLIGTNYLLEVTQ